MVKIDDLEKILKMRGLEEELNNFTNKVKELIDAMQKKIKDENEKKLDEIRVDLQLSRNQNKNYHFVRSKPNVELSRLSLTSRRTTDISRRYSKTES